MTSNKHKQIYAYIHTHTHSLSLVLSTYIYSVLYVQSLTIRQRCVPSILRVWVWVCVCMYAYICLFLFEVISYGYLHFHDSLVGIDRLLLLSVVKIRTWLPRVSWRSKLKWISELDLTTHTLPSFIFSLYIEFQRQRLVVACVNITDFYDVESRRPCTLESLRKFGITHFLDQVVDAPPIVKAALVMNSNLHAIGAGTQETERHLEDLRRSSTLQCFFTPDSCRSFHKSRYGKQNTSTRVDTLKPGRLLIGGWLNRADQ